MNKNWIKVIIVAVLLIGFILVYSNMNKDVNQEPPAEKQPEPVKYFTPGSDKITIIASEDALYTDNPSTTLSYYAVDNSNQRVQFKEGERAFVRIMGVSHFYNANTEIMRKNNTLFSGEITIDGGPGTYTIKVCLGKSINLDSDGVMVWPFGCFEDGSSERIDIYE